MKKSTPFDVDRSFDQLGGQNKQSILTSGSGFGHKQSKDFGFNFSGGFGGGKKSILDVIKNADSSIDAIVASLDTGERVYDNIKVFRIIRNMVEGIKAYYTRENAKESEHMFKKFPHVMPAEGLDFNYAMDVYIENLEAAGESEENQQELPKPNRIMRYQPYFREKDYPHDSISFIDTLYNFIVMNNPIWINYLCAKQFIMKRRKLFPNRKYCLFDSNLGEQFCESGVDFFDSVKVIFGKDYEKLMEKLLVGRTHMTLPVLLEQL